MSSWWRRDYRRTCATDQKVLDRGDAWLSPWWFQRWFCRATSAIGKVSSKVEGVFFVLWAGLSEWIWTERTGNRNFFSVPRKYYPDQAYVPVQASHRPHLPLPSQTSNLASNRYLWYPGCTSQWIDISLLLNPRSFLRFALGVTSSKKYDKLDTIGLRDSNFDSEITLT